MRSFCTVRTHWPVEFKQRSTYVNQFDKVGFDVPSNGAKYCFIKFKLPPRELDPNGYPWSVSGSGKFDVYPLDGIIRVGHLTWNRRLARASQDPIAQVVVSVPLGILNSQFRGYSTNGFICPQSNLKLVDLLL